MRFILSLFFLSFAVFGFGQVTADKEVHDFGKLYPNMQTYVDITFTNNTDKTQHLFRIEKPRGVFYEFSGKVILPDSSITIRLGVDNGISGKFAYEVLIHLSSPSTPVKIKLYGNIKEASSNPMMACPDFNSSPPANNPAKFAITVRVIDSLTREPIRRSKVYFVQNNTLIGEYYTDKDGIIHREFPMGYYYITAEKETYYSNYKMGYLNFQRNYVEIELQQPEVEEEPIIEEESELIVEVEDPVEEEPIEEEEEEDENEIVIVINNDPVEEVVEEVVVDTIIELPPVVEEPEYIDDTPLAELPDTLFDEGHFKLNNITFILDVSSSMNSMGKIDLLKLSMRELVDVLRPNDIISVIKYSSSVSVVVDGLSGKDKIKITERVDKLRTSSSTAGGDAINVAYQMNKRDYSEKRNNIVIMVTDGAFNKGSKTYMETIEKNYKERGIIFSVVGIKTSPYVATHMNKVVSKAQGSFIEIRTATDAKTKIYNEIRRTSFRGRN